MLSLDLKGDCMKILWSWNIGYNKVRIRIFSRKWKRASGDACNIIWWLFIYSIHIFKCPKGKWRRELLEFGQQQ